MYALPKDSTDLTLRVCYTPTRKPIVESDNTFLPPPFFFFFNLFYLFIFGCIGSSLLWALSSCGEGGLLFTAVRGLLIAVASLVLVHGL